MKRLIPVICGFVLLSAGILNKLHAADLTGVKIYVNPGHGGHDPANDRNVQTIPFALGDPNGYWESNSNLTKGLALRDLLRTANATVYISRTTNTDADDRSLSAIAAEANASNVDAFLSIHSNATDTKTNYLLLLYHGYDNDPTVTASLPLTEAAWPHLLSNQLTAWNSTSKRVRGDFSFYGNTSGLGVLRPLTVPGYLSEGSFHDYPPETHRLLNGDYCKLEAILFYRSFYDYFQKDLPQTGVIAGCVRSENEKMTHPVWYSIGTADQWTPLNGATVKLWDAAGRNV
jgi:N-acetylmuramoyl-L-alanine amidase